jgi:hypothetical protein
LPPIARRLLLPGDDDVPAWIRHQQAHDARLNVNGFHAEHAEAISGRIQRRESIRPPELETILPDLRRSCDDQRVD